MSLLMDALRRAEHEKKQQQARGRSEPQDQPATPAVGTRPVASHAAGSEDVTIQIEAAAVERASAAFGADATMVGDDGDASVAFSLEAEDEASRVAAASAGLELEPLEQASADDPALSADPTVAGADHTDATALSALGRVNQTQTMPSSRALENDLNDYFDRSQSVEMPRRTHPGDVTLEDVAAHTVAGARTVFSAGEAPRSKRMFVAAAAVALLLVLGIAGVGVFYAQRDPAPRYLPPPTVADGVERPLQRALPVVPLEPTPAPSVSELVRLETAAPLNPPAPNVASDRSAAADSALAAPPPTDKAPAQIAPDPAPSPELNVAAAPQPPPPPQPLAPQSRAAAPATPDPRPAVQRGVGAGELTISHSRTPAAVDANVERAYAAFNAGDIDAAADLYTAALATDPEQRDALLGLAAVALARGDEQGAFLHYAAVLSAHPGDAVATAALVGLGSDGRGINAARLRVMLDKHRDVPFLHFTLGNWFARQGRWGDAQQAYFDAVALDAGNADYAYNLAVSLDHLGQAGAALEYYQKSLALVDDSPGNFNPASVLERINTLTAGAAAR